MTPLLKKLNYKNQKEIVVLNFPGNFQSELQSMEVFTSIKTTLKETKEVSFVIVFCTKQEEVNNYCKEIASKLVGDAVVWFAYPKGTSKRYKCEFNRDTGWVVLGQMGLEPVRIVAIDEDWSALRFRKADYIKTMTRSFAMTEKGKEKVAKSKK